MAYIYHIVVDGIIRYVGKGNGKRKDAHMRTVRSIARRRSAGDIVETRYLYHRLVDAWITGADIKVVIDVDKLSEKQAYDIESKQISALPDLWNSTAGGYGGCPLGLPGSKKRRSAIQKSKWTDPVYRSVQISRFKQGWAEKFSTSIKKSIIDLLSLSPGLRPVDIKSSLGLSKTQVHNNLSSLFHAGLVQREDGIYFAANDLTTDRREAINRAMLDRRRDKKEAIQQSVSKLTKEEVVLIRSALKSGEAGTDIAKRFNVTGANISSIKNGLTWVTPGTTPILSKSTVRHNMILELITEQPGLKPQQIKQRLSLSERDLWSGLEALRKKGNIRKDGFYYFAVPPPLKLVENS